MPRLWAILSPLTRPDSGRRSFARVLPPLAVLGMLSILAGCSLFAPRPAPPPPPPAYDMRSYEKTEPGCGDHGHRDQACVSFTASWPDFKGPESNGNSAAPKLNAAVYAVLGFPGGPSELEPYAAALVERWRVEHKGVIYADSTWFERRAIHVLAHRPEVWSFQYDRLGQTGHEVPFEERVYYNLDPRTGAAVTLDSLLEKDAAPRLASLAEQHLRESLSLDAAAPLPLKDARFALPQIYALTPAGLILSWSGEALADPAAPRLEVTLPWNLVRDLVRKSAVNPPGPAAAPGF